MFEYGENVHEQKDTAIEAIKRSMSLAAYMLAEADDIIDFSELRSKGAQILQEP